MSNVHSLECFDTVPHEIVRLTYNDYKVKVHDAKLKHYGQNNLAMAL